jgi:hypothetical protein
VEADPSAADQLVEFKLRRLPDRWQVAEIGNGRALVRAPWKRAAAGQSIRSRSPWS